MSRSACVRLVTLEYGRTFFERLQKSAASEEEPGTACFESLLSVYPCVNIRMCMLLCTSQCQWRMTSAAAWLKKQACMVIKKEFR
eukprot:4750978-Amphidinium_carterae.2